MISIRKRILNWELWPFYLIYSPLGFVWMYYTFKARAFWFSSNVNPTLEFSGIEGESKMEMYDQLPVSLYPSTVLIKAKQSFEEVKNTINEAGIKYPFIAKPDVGMQGIMFRKLENEEQLKQYHTIIPANYVVQDLVDLPYEFSVFHIRYPNATKGIVTGFILKEYLEVYGDGTSTLLELIQKHPRASLRMQEMRHKHENHLNNVLPKGERYYLSIAGNHNRGTKFINLHKEIDEALCSVFDKISLQAKHFYFGRYDLKCSSIADLKEGKNISILEYNGAGSEPNHIYDCGMTYGRALKEIMIHWEHMYRIGRINKKAGIPYWSFFKGIMQMQKAKRFFKMLRVYDEKF